MADNEFITGPGLGGGQDVRVFDKLNTAEGQDGSDILAANNVDDPDYLEAAGLEVIVAATTTEVYVGWGDDLINADDRNSDASNATDDVYVDGRIITAENYDAAAIASGDNVLDFASVDGSDENATIYGSTLRGNRAGNDTGETETRETLEAAGLEVVVAAATTEVSGDVNGRGGSDVVIGSTGLAAEGGDGFNFVRMTGDDSVDDDLYVGAELYDVEIPVYDLEPVTDPGREFFWTAHNDVIIDSVEPTGFDTIFDFV